jgi:hypothetical protein
MWSRRFYRAYMFTLSYIGLKRKIMLGQFFWDVFFGDTNLHIEKNT